VDQFSAAMRVKKGVQESFEKLDQILIGQKPSGRLS
jgi:hypothetical protein